MNNLSKTFAARVQEARPGYKFGVHIPKSVKHVLYFDKINGDNLLREAIEKGLKQINDYKTSSRLKVDKD